jgi:hypothetical protein
VILKIHERQFSPDLQRRLVETAAHTKSFRLAVKMAQLWTEQAFSERHIGRITEEVGEELAAARAAEVDDFVHHRREAEGADPHHELAVVLLDGGRMQTRAEILGQGPGVHEAHWREDKVARLQTMAAKTFAVDPCPEPPECFLDPKKLQKLLKPEEEVEPPAEKTVESKQIDAERVQASRWQPVPLVRTCVATMAKVDEFRWMVWAEAKRRHFFTAAKRAFVGDGQDYNWTIHERLFPDFVAIIDFLHVASYLYGAALVIGRTAADPKAETAALYHAWVRASWQGRVDEVLPILEAALVGAGIGAETQKDDHPWRPVQRAATYLRNHRGKMNYPEYRRQGLPTTSSLIESQIKEFNYRVKGSEKFWNEDHAEAMLQVIARCLRDDGQDLREYMANRPGRPFRRRANQTIGLPTAA